MSDDAELIAAAPEMAAMLRDLEWSGGAAEPEPPCRFVDGCTRPYDCPDYDERPCKPLPEEEMRRHLDVLMSRDDIEE